MRYFCFVLGKCKIVSVNSTQKVMHDKEYQWLWIHALDEDIRRKAEKDFQMAKEIA